MRQRTDRIHGPYKHGRRWRLKVVYADGSVEYPRESEGGPLGFTTRTGALTYRDGWRGADAPTIAASVDEFIAACRARGLKETTVTTLGHRLRALLVTTRERPVYELATEAEGLLAARVAAGDSAATQLGLLRAARQYAAWEIGRGNLEADPWAGMRQVGRVKRGKPQLTIDETRRLYETCIRDAHPTAGIAVAVAIATGARASEVAGIEARDVDDGGRVLWIRGTKTEAAQRSYLIPDAVAELRDRIVWLARTARTGPIWGLTWRGRPADRHWVYHHVRRLCAAARVPVIPPHGVRGTFSSLAARRLDLQGVADLLGQGGDTATAERHYVAPGTVQRARQDAALQVIRGGRTG